MADFLTSVFFVSGMFLVSNKHQGTIFSQFVTLKNARNRLILCLTVKDTQKFGLSQTSVINAYDHS